MIKLINKKNTLSNLKFLILRTHTENNWFYIEIYIRKIVLPKKFLLNAKYSKSITKNENELFSFSTKLNNIEYYMYL